MNRFLAWRAEDTIAYEVNFIVHSTSLQQKVLKTIVYT